MCLSNFKVMRSFKQPISRLRGFTRSHSETSYQILKRCPCQDSIPIRFRLLTGGWFPLKSANSASTPAHGTRRKNAMHQISHRNFLVVGSDISAWDSRPPWQVSDTEKDRSPLGIHGPQKQSQFYKPYNKTITKLLYHRLPTFLRQRTPIFHNIQIHISWEIITKLFDILSFLILRHQLLQNKISLTLLQKLDDDKLKMQFCLQHSHSLFTVWLSIYVCRYILLISIDSLQYWNKAWALEILHNIIYIYIMLCKISRAQALFQYLIWCYHISSRMHEDCILFDHFKLWHASPQQCCSTALSPPDSLRRVSNFQVKQSRIFVTSWDLESSAVDKKTCPGV